MRKTLFAVMAAATLAVSACANQPDPISVVESHQFNGSSTEVRAFEKWFAGEKFEKPLFTTKDLRPLSLPDGSRANHGDTVGKMSDDSFSVINR